MPEDIQPARRIREIPGFYFDEGKNRYFRISSRGDPRQLKVPERKTVIDDESKPSQNAEANVLQILLKCETGDYRTLSNLQRRYIEKKASKPYLWSYGATSCADGAVEEFRANVQTREGLKDADMIIWGNSYGVAGVSEVIQTGCAIYGNTLPEPVRVFPPSRPSVHKFEDTSCPPDLKPSCISKVARSKVTAIRKLASIKEGDKDSLILTTLGSGFEGGALYHLQQQVFDRSWSFDQPLPLASTPIVTDCSIWTAGYCVPDKATIGTSKGAALVHLETSILRWLIRSKSDVLSQECDSLGNLVFCGFRNGYITMVDIRSSSQRPVRMPSVQTRTESSSFIRARINSSKGAAQSYLQKKTPLRDEDVEIAKNFCETMRMMSAICSLILLRSDESYLLAGAMNGDINLWDRRLAGRGPVVSYDGNMNTCLPLRLGVDSSESLLFSGGEDSCVRIWSLCSGKLLQTVRHVPAIVHNFSTSYSNLSPSLTGNHAWRMWLGSSTGVMYMHG